MCFKPGTRPVVERESGLDDTQPGTLGDGPAELGGRLRGDADPVQHALLLVARQGFELRCRQCRRTLAQGKQ